METLLCRCHIIVPFWLPFITHISEGHVFLFKVWEIESGSWSVMFRSVIAGIDFSFNSKSIETLAVLVVTSSWLSAIIKGEIISVQTMLEHITATSTLTLHFVFISWDHYKVLHCLRHFPVMSQQYSLECASACVQEWELQKRDSMQLLSNTFVFSGAVSAEILSYLPRAIM